MDRQKERRLLNEFIDGLREYMKQDGRFAGKPIAPRWHSLSEQEQYDEIDKTLINHADYVVRIAHDSIHSIR